MRRLLSAKARSPGGGRRRLSAFWRANQVATTTSHHQQKQNAAIAPPYPDSIGAWHGEPDQTATACSESCVKLWWEHLHVAARRISRATREGLLSVRGGSTVSKKVVASQLADLDSTDVPARVHARRFAMVD
jgi:hypothetical protein